MKHVLGFLFLVGLGIAVIGMEKEVVIPKVYHADKGGLDSIVQEEILKHIDNKKIEKGVKQYVRAHHAGCTKEEEREYIQNIKKQAIENRVKKSILEHVRQNFDVTNVEEKCGVILQESSRWQIVIDQINFGVLVFDGKGKLVIAEEKNKNKH